MDQSNYHLNCRKVCRNATRPLRSNLPLPCGIANVSSCSETRKLKESCFLQETPHICEDFPIKYPHKNELLEAARRVNVTTAAILILVNRANRCREIHKSVFTTMKFMVGHNRFSSPLPPQPYDETLDKSLLKE